MAIPVNIPRYALIAAMSMFPNHTMHSPARGISSMARVHGVVDAIVNTMDNDNGNAFHLECHNIASSLPEPDMIWAWCPHPRLCSSHKHAHR